MGVASRRRKIKQSRKTTETMSGAAVSKVASREKKKEMSRHTGGKTKSCKGQSCPSAGGRKKSTSRSKTVKTSSTGPKTRNVAVPRFGGTASSQRAVSGGSATRTKTKSKNGAITKKKTVTKSISPSGRVTTTRKKKKY